MLIAPVAAAFFAVLTTPVAITAGLALPATLLAVGMLGSAWTPIAITALAIPPGAVASSTISPVAVPVLGATAILPRRPVGSRGWR